MMNMLSRIALACLLPLALTGCLLVPGKFNSALTIRADRTFTFTYVGQVIASDPSEGISGDTPPKPDATPEERADYVAKAREKVQKAKERETKNREIAAALAKEAGYRSVVYKGNGLFEVDYSVSGLLTTNFIFPFNSDAEVMIPFLAIEVRRDGTVRMRAPAFGKSGNPASAGAAMPTIGDPSDRAEGTFTLTTDAEIVMQNQENGPQQAGSNKVITWTVGALKKDAPTAVLRMRN